MKKINKICNEICHKLKPTEKSTKLKKQSVRACINNPGIVTSFGCYNIIRKGRHIVIFDFFNINKNKKVDIYEQI